MAESEPKYLCKFRQTLKAALEELPFPEDTITFLKYLKRDLCKIKEKANLPDIETSQGFLLQYFENGQLVWCRSQNPEKCQGDTVFKFEQSGALARVKSALQAALAEIETLPEGCEFIGG